MAEYVALKTFLGRFGQMHRGMVYTLPDGYGNDLMRNGLVRRKAIVAAPRNAAHQEAPSTLGEDTADRKVAGPAPPSSASPPARLLRRRIASTLNRGPK